MCTFFRNILLRGLIVIVLITPVIAFSENGSETTSDPGVTLTGEKVTETNPACQDGDDGYCLLAPIPGLSSVASDTSIGKYLNIIISFAIGFAAVLAVVMLVIAGIEYMSSDAFTKKEEAKSRITHAIGGLLLALGAFLILNTINPKLVNLSLSIKSQEITILPPVDDPLEFELIPEYASLVAGRRTTGGFDTQAEKEAAVNSVPIFSLHDLTAIPYEVKAGTGTSVVTETLWKKLGVMKNAYQGDEKLLVTEAFKPGSYKHKSKCHYYATCIDLAFRNQNGGTITATGADVKALLDAANVAGLQAQFEVPTEARVREIGIGAPSVIIVTYATGEHFSIYDTK